MDNLETIFIPKSIFKKLLRHAQDTLPNECVALLGGEVDSTIAYIKHSFFS